MIDKSWKKNLEKLNPCKDAYEWAISQPSAATAWQSCRRGDWMLWLLGKQCRTAAQRRKLVLAACACARLSLPHVRSGEPRPLRAIETAEDWANRKSGVTLEMVKAASAEYAAADSAASAAAYAASAAAYEASAASAAAYAAADAADAAEYAAYAAEYAAYAAIRISTLSQCADIVRGFYPLAPRL